MSCSCSFQVGKGVYEQTLSFKHFTVYSNCLSDRLLDDLTQSRITKGEMLPKRINNSIISLGTLCVSQNKPHLIILNFICSVLVQEIQYSHGNPYIKSNMIPAKICNKLYFLFFPALNSKSCSAPGHLVLIILLAPCPFRFYTILIVDNKTADHLYHSCIINMVKWVNIVWEWWGLWTILTHLFALFWRDYFDI